MQRQRPIIGIMGGYYNADYSTKLVKTISETLSSQGAEFHFYFGSFSLRLLDRFTLDDVGLDCHYYSLFTYSHFDRPDILVIAYGSLTLAHEGMDIHQFISKVPDVPVILLGDSTALDRNPYSINITIDNDSGLKQVIEHLIRVHGRKNIGYLSGPKENHDAIKRLQAYKDVLSENYLPVKEEHIVYGDFFYHDDAQADFLFQNDPNLDAIVSANDEMTQSIYRVAKKKHRQIGKDLSVTGFDDIRMES